MNEKTARESLIQELVRGGYLKTPAIIKAFRAIDRKDFVPKDLEGEAYGNYPLPIGFGQTISQPLTVAFMIELLEPQPGEKILDIGSGSGWQTALLAHIVGKSHGRVIAIERLPELKEMTEANISKYNFVKKRIAKAVLGDGSKGYPDQAPFDKIIAAAALASPQTYADNTQNNAEKIPRPPASVSSAGEWRAGKSALSQRESATRDAIPREWKEQLKIGGRIVAPIQDSVFVFDKISEHEFAQKEYFGFSFVPLVS